MFESFGITRYLLIVCAIGWVQQGHQGKRLVGDSRKDFFRIKFKIVDFWLSSQFP